MPQENFEDHRCRCYKVLGEREGTPVAADALFAICVLEFF